jgi:hypothetical protein
MATTWIEEKGDIPEEYTGIMSRDVTQEAEYEVTYTDGKETSRKEITPAKAWTEYQRYYEDPEGNQITGDWGTSENPGGLSGTYYRPGSGKGKAPVQRQAAEKIQKLQEQFENQCNSYKGAQYTACMKAATAKVQQLAKREGFASGGLVQTKGYAEGGEVMSVPEEQMQAMMAQEQMMPPMPEEEMAMPEEQDNSDMVERIASVLSQEEMVVLNEALDMHPELVVILDKAMDAISTTGEFDGEGPVSGPGTETSDSIPARLSDGEFVFTAKAVKQIGVDKLRKMMAKAEDDYDTAMYKQEGNQMEAAGNEEGYFLGGLLDQTRKQWGNVESATTEYQQPMERTVPTNVDGMGRMIPEGQTGIMGRRTVDLAAQQRDQSGKQQMNTNTQSTAPAAAASPSLMGAVNMNAEEQRAMEQQQLQQNTQEPEDEQSLMG